MIENPDIQKIIDSYEVAESSHEIWDHPVVKMLRSLFPPVPLLSTFVDETVEYIFKQHQLENEAELYSAIFSDSLITLDDVKNINYLMDFAKTLDAVRRMNSNKKIKFVAELFKSYHTPGNEYLEDEFDEYLSRFTDLSFRELSILAYLYECENNVPKIGNTGDINPNGTYDYFEKTAQQHFDLSLNEITSILAGTMRSGFVNITVINSPGHIRTIYYLTDYFRKFMEKISHDSQTENKSELHFTTENR